MTVRVFDAGGKEQDLIWAKDKYNIIINECPRDVDHWELVELREKVSCPAALVVYINGEPKKGIPAAFYYEGAEHKSAPGEPKPRKDVKATNKEGHTGFGMGPGAFYNPRLGPGPHSAWISQYLKGIPSDELAGIGMVGHTNHDHLDPVFLFVRAGEPGPGPDPEPDPGPGEDLTFDVSGTITLKQRR